MNGLLLTAGILTCTTLIAGQPRQPQTSATDDLQLLNDEFNDSSTLSEWQRHAMVENWPDQVHSLDVNQTSPGHLYLEPEVSGWFEDYRGVLLFKEITGDFVATTRVRVTGLNSLLPTRDFTLAGLMARAPRIGSQQWNYGEEDWLFIATGRGADPLSPQIERKTTINSISSLVLSPASSGWVDLRVVRRGATFRLYRRFDGEPWALHWTYDRPDLPPTLQVGLVAYTDWPTVSSFSDPLEFNQTVVPSPPGGRDMIARFDFVRFRRP